jgi:hypothetical protein
MNQVCIATICWARTKEEEQLLRPSLLQLSSLDIPIFITDGGSNAAFVDYIKSLPNMHVLDAPEKGLWAQAKHSLLAAKQHGSNFILYTEPDKLIFFRDHLQTLLQHFSFNESIGIHLAARTTSAFHTFPAFQQMTETTINNCCTEVTASKFDYTYGPFLLNKRLLDYIDVLPADIGWGWRPFMFCMARRSGLHVTETAGEFGCPTDQQQDDENEKIYRMKQLEQNIRGIVLATSTEL